MDSQDQQIYGREHRKTPADTPEPPTSRRSSTIDLWATVGGIGFEQDVHMIPLDDLFKRFHTNPRRGLSSDFVPDAQAQYGDNKIPPPKSPNYFCLLLSQLFMGFNSILWVAGIFAFLAYEPLGEPNPSITNLGLGVVLFLVITCNAILNLYQKIKSIKIVASFSKLLPAIATVRRDGIEQQIVADQLVPGDIILIRMGDKLPADCRFLVCDGLKVYPSKLTGESKSVTATVRCTNPNFMETTNIGFYSSLVEQGTGEGVVIATGENTVLGKMSRLIRSDPDDEITCLHHEVNRFVLFIVMAAMFGIISLWIFWAAWLEFVHPTFVTLNRNILNSIAMIVAFLPLGLPSAVTLVLIIVAKRMYQQCMLIKSLQIVETFDAVSVIATDKTGTLTQNKMTVTHLFWDTDNAYKVPEFKEEPIKKVNIGQKVRRLSVGALNMVRPVSVSPAPFVETLSNGNINESQIMPSFSDDNQRNNISNVGSEVKIQAFRDLLLGASLCNNAQKQIIQDVQLDQDISKMKSELRLVGDAVDVALYNLCVDRCHIDIDKVRNTNPRLKVLPFNSSNKFMISANQLETEDLSLVENEHTVLITLKGALDIVIQRCSSYKTNDDLILPLTTEVKEKLFNRQETLGKNGACVIAMCQQKFTKQQYNQMMLRYEARRRMKIVDIEDLNGFPANNYCFIGMFSLLDPPRVEVPESVLKARRSQIRVAMVTGDHPTTAKAIAKQVNIFTSEIAERNGIDSFKIEQNQVGQSVLRLYRNETLLEEHIAGKLTPFTPGSKAAREMIKQIQIDANKSEFEKEPPWYKRCCSWCQDQFSESKSNLKKARKKEYIPYAIAVSGSQIDFMDDFMWDWVLSHQELVFARTSPEQKLLIVLEFQRRQETVAVTGDGINDAPALKCGDLGVAMQSGTEVAKEAGDMILLDNSFSSIIQAIEKNRLLSDNLKKVAIYLLPGGSWSEIWPVFFNIWFGMPLALSAFLATIFCMLNDVFMSLAMVTEKAERNIMSRPPSNRQRDHLLNLRLLVHAYLFVGNVECFSAFFCFCYYWIDNGVPFYSFMFTYENFGTSPPLPYSSDQLAQMTNTAQSIYYCSLCTFQFFNFFATRTRYASILEHNPIWGKSRNWYVFGCMIISVVIQLIITQVNWFNEVFGTAPVPVKYVMPTLGFGLLWLIIDELRKLYIRKFPRSIAAKIAW